MKRTTRLWFALSLALPFAACPADDDGEDDGAGTEPTSSATVTVGDDSGSATVTVGDDAPGTDDGADDAPGTDDGADDAPDTGADDGGGMACVHTCAANEDCFIGGADIGFICEASACVNGNPCTDDAFCVAQLSGWSAIPCTMGGGECMAAGQICVDLGDGTGGCATPPSEFFMCETVAGWAEVMATNLDDGSEATVCGNPNAVCNTEGGFCESPCMDDTTCAPGWVCDVPSGACQCDGDDDCSALGEGSTCDAGACTVPGCMSDADCMNTFDGGTIACQ